MAQPSGETITLRALGPLPELDSVVFVRKLNRAFVTGRGPLGPPSPRPARRFLRIGMWLMLFTGVVISLLVGAAESLWLRLLADPAASLVPPPAPEHLATA